MNIKDNKAVFVGIVILAIMLLIMFWIFISSNIFNGFKKSSETFDTKNIHTIDVDFASYNIVAEIHSGKDIKLSWYSEKNAYCETDESNGILTVKYHNGKNRFSLSSLRFVKKKYHTLKIELPKEYLGKISLSSQSGQIDADGINVESGISVSTLSGTIEINNASSGQDIRVTATSGNIKMKDITLNGDYYGKIDNGNIDVFNIGNAKSFKLEATSGQIYFQNITADVFMADSTSGNIRFKDIYANDSVTLSATSGNIKGNISDKNSEYSFISSSTSGSVKLPANENGIKGDKILDVKTGSENIEIKFDK
ncbi:MAG: DUF4097 family beta strand repeat-containing protein [Anaerocolumna sp.]